jgi:two-component system, OmpR family, response regulator
MARILLIEDYDLVRNILADAIEETGHTGHNVRTKAEGDAALDAEPYDLVICNIRLPDGSGLDIASKAAELGVQTVLMTGHPDEIQALLISGIAHLKKPFRLEEFVQLIQERLGPKPSDEGPG